MMSTIAADADPVASAPRAGADLRAARERLGWSLEDVAAALRIRLPFLLKRWKAGRIADLPGNAYALGFLRTYASALGLDPDELARRFKAEAAEVNQLTELMFPGPGAAARRARRGGGPAGRRCWRSAPMPAGTGCPANGGCRPRRCRRCPSASRRWPSRPFAHRSRDPRPRRWRPPAGIPQPAVRADGRPSVASAASARRRRAPGSQVAGPPARSPGQPIGAQHLGRRQAGARGRARHALTEPVVPPTQAAAATTMPLATRRRCSHASC